MGVWYGQAHKTRAPTEAKEKGEKVGESSRGRTLSIWEMLGKVRELREGVLCGQTESLLTSELLYGI